MSLPLTRRIARAALLVAAGAAAGAGAAGSAAAAPGLPAAPPLGGLTAPDVPAAGAAVEDTTRTVTETGGRTVDGARRTVGDTAGTATGHLPAEVPAQDAPTGAVPAKGLLG